MIEMHHHDRYLYPSPKDVPARTDETPPPDSVAEMENSGELLVSNASGKLVPSSLIALLVFLVIFPIFVVLIRICRARSHARTNNTGSQSIRNEDNGQRNKTKRTNRAQEAIEKNLILKQVIVLDDAPTKPQVDTTMYTTMYANYHAVPSSDNPGQAGTGGRRKCDLVIRPRTSHKDELDKSRTCSICLCNYEHGDRICYSRNQTCIHRFHLNCAVSWFTKRDECPVCRADYLMEHVEENAVTGIARDPPEPQEVTISAGGGAVSELPIGITREEGDIESGSLSLPIFHDGNGHERHLCEAARSLETDDEATEVITDDSDVSSHTFSNGDRTQDVLCDNRVESHDSDGACTPRTVDRMASIDSTTSTEQIVPCPSTGSDNI